jgi:PAS domain S-box-containing protein
MPDQALTEEWGESAFRLLLDTAPDAMVVVNGDGTIVLVNIQAERMFDCDRRKLVGEKVEVLIPERFRGAHVGHRSGFMGEKRARPMGSGLELFGRKRDGTEFPIEISLSPLTIGQAIFVSAAIRDISDRKGTEEELRRARALAEAASSAKSEFLSSMSHELRTPLNAILGFAQLLQRDKKTPLSERQQERVEHVLKGGEYLLRLIDEVLDLSRIEAGRVSVSPEPVRVADVLSEVRSTLQPMAARNQSDIVVASLAGLPDVVADRTRFKQILMNYGSNAIKYGRKEGTVTFRSELRGGHVRVTVQDDGLGIPQDKQDKIFSPFHRAGQEAGPIEGTGIGLAISKRLAELMDGCVGFNSAAGRGSEFWIELPVHRAVAGDAALAPRTESASLAALAQPDGERFRIVYVEDNPSNIAFMQDLLADYRVELEVAPTAEIGLELIRSLQPNAVIMDINLPGMSGIAATKLLREWPETSHIPVIGLSAAAMAHDAARVNAAGFYRYLTKPVKVDELTQTLEEILNVRG